MLSRWAQGRDAITDMEVPSRSDLNLGDRLTPPQPSLLSKPNFIDPEDVEINAGFDDPHASSEETFGPLADF